MVNTKVLTIGLASLLLISCSNNFERSISQSIQDNEKATNHYEWETSPNHPEFLFEKFRQDVSQNKNSAELCNALSSISNADLTLFENQINAEINKELIRDCKNSLTQKLNVYWQEQKEEMNKVYAVSARTSENYKFQTLFLRRDFSRGYYAVTGDVAKKELVLTFDDGPHASYTPSILNTLEEVDAKATFLTLGQNVRRYPNILQAIASDGHSIGSHSVRHYCLGGGSACLRNNGRSLSQNEVISEIRGGHQAVYDVLGWVDPIFRFPYGSSNRQLKAYLAQNSVAEFFWSIDTLDWKKQTNTQLLNNILKMIDSKQKGIILMHDIQRRTAEVLPTLLRQIYNRGYSLAVLQDLDDKSRHNSKLVIPRDPHP